MTTVLLKKKKKLVPMVKSKVGFGRSSCDSYVSSATSEEKGFDFADDDYNPL